MNNVAKKNIMPIFIVGMNGSGTTMLSDCLNNHPKIFILGRESRVIPYYYFNIANYGDLEVHKNFNELLYSFSNNKAFWICNNYQTLNIPVDLEKIEHKNLAVAIDLTFSHFARRDKKEIWGDHSPQYALHIPLLIDLFPYAKIVHIIRDGRDCAFSFNRRFGYNLYHAIYDWRKLVEKARNDGVVAGKDRYLEIKYEDLTSSPEMYMKQICSFLSVPYSPKTLISNMPEFSGNVDDANTIIANSGKWRRNLSEEKIKKLENIAGKTLRKCGYEVIYNDGNNDIRDYKIFILKWLNRVNAAISYNRRYQGKHKLRRFIKGVAVSLKQRSNN